MLNSTTKGNPPSRPGAKPEPELNGRKILLGVCGGIAAYKAVELTRLFVKHGARVQVVMTDAAGKFITPLTFETITGRNVFAEMFPAHGDYSPWHTELATWPDLAVIAPATANHMARLAVGIADDLLSTVMLTLDRPRLLCPSMNHRMWANPATQENVSTLKRRGFRFVMPEEGQMARPGEEEGVGRLAELDAIFREVSHMLSAPQDLRGVRVLVTGGRTEESWDPVRVLTNRSTGRMGFALAEEARERGADVVLIHGPTDVIPPTGVRIRRVTTAAEMAAAVKQEFFQSKIVLMAAAVADYTFAKTVEHKIKKGEPAPAVQLVSTEDILKSLAGKKEDRIVVGFALETENVLENALKKLRDKHLDMVVANNPLALGSGFATETNQVLIIHRSGRVTELPLQSKREAARDILNAVIENYRNPEPELEPDEVLLLDEDEGLGGLDLEGLEIEDLTVEEGPTPAPVHEAPPPQRSPNGRGGKRHKKHRDHKPHDQQPIHAEHPGEPVVAQATIHSPARAPVMADAETVSDLPGSVLESPSELPFPGGAAPAPGAKKSRGRRGGRRAQRARAKREAAAVAGESGGAHSPVAPATGVHEHPAFSAPEAHHAPMQASFSESRQEPKPGPVVAGETKPKKSRRAPRRKTDASKPSSATNIENKNAGNE